MSETKEVQIRRKKEKNHLPNSVLDGARKKIGSVFMGRQPLRALKSNEEKELLPRLVGIDLDSREWERKSRDFWAEFFIDVPSGGVVLDITLDPDRTSEAFPNGFPVNIEDYIAYRFAQAHKYVADSEERMLSNPLKSFYIFDPEKADVRQANVARSRMQANGELYALVKDMDTDEAAQGKMHRVFRILTGINPSRMNNLQIMNRLETIVQSEPDRFYSVVTDKDLTAKAMLDEMIELSVLRRQGNHVLYNEDVVGHTTEEAILFFRDKKNAQTLTVLKASLLEARKTVTS